VTRTRAFWLTNLATPYRVALWEALGRRIDLSVGVLAEREPLRLPWPATNASSYRSVRVPCWQLSRPGHELALYIARGVGDMLDAVEAEVLIVTSWESPAYQLGMLAARRRGIPIVLHYGTTPLSHRFIRGPVAWLRWSILRSASAIVSYGQTTTEEIVRWGVEPGRIVTSFNSVDVEWISKRVAELRCADPSAPVGHVFLAVGRLLPRKNLANLLAAFARVREPADRLHVAGDGPERRYLEAGTRELGLQRCVSFLGHLEGDALMAAYACAHTLVMPSTAEVWGLVVNEALAAGLNVVVSDVSGCARDVRPMPGVFVVSTDADGIAAGMAASRESFAGPAASPEILARGIGPLAASFEEAIACVLRGPKKSRVVGRRSRERAVRTSGSSMVCERRSVRGQSCPS
jgi:glycosyltransferase involved in cell wall biosynthesis